MPRRDYGTGSITAKGADRWQLRYYGAPDPLDGERRRKAETFHGTKRDAAARLQHLTNLAGVDTSAISLGEMIDRWLADTHHERSTLVGYALGRRTLAAPLLATPLAAITAARVREVIKTVEMVHGVHRARRVHATISGALSHAWRNEWIATNPARKVIPPAAPRRLGTPPSPEEVKRLLAVVADNSQYTAWLTLSLMSGARRSEILALHWIDVDLERGQINIDSAIDPEDGHLKDTKSHGQRTVPLGARTVAVLARWLADATERHGGPLPADAYVFSDAVDSRSHWRPDRATVRFAKIRKRAGVTGVRLYDTRHYFATELLSGGADQKAVSTLLGHSRESTTQNSYSHVKPGRHRELAERLERGLD